MQNHDISKGIHPRMQSAKKKFNQEQIKFFYQSNIFGQPAQYQDFDDKSTKSQTQSQSDQQQRIKSLHGSPNREYHPIYSSNLKRIKEMSPVCQEQPLINSPRQSRDKYTNSFPQKKAERIWHFYNSQYEKIDFFSKKPEKSPVKEQPSTYLQIHENAVKQTKEFFSKPKQQDENPPELNEIQQFLVRQNVTKDQIIQDYKIFEKILIELSIPKILELKTAYDIERRKNFKPAIIIQAQNHFNNIINTFAEILLQYYDLPQHYQWNQQVISKKINNQILEQQCQKILFSKEEVMDYLNYIIKNCQQIMMQSNVKDILFQYTYDEKKIILNTLVLDQAYSIEKFEDYDEYKAISLFSDDPEVLQLYYLKTQTLQKAITEFLQKI
ncbi:hypothetical protein pb186bvf_003611 [Paramecium bursaria]